MVDLQRQQEVAFGHVKPIISFLFKDYRFVAVGNGLLWSRDWRTVADFLIAYIEKCFGAPWYAEEKRIPVGAAHPAFEWFEGLRAFQKRNNGNQEPGGLFFGERDGPTAAYLLLAYDLFILAHHQALQESLLRRLRRKESFQGARYELAVAALFIRAGFELEHEDETDSTLKHPEFIATHLSTGQRLAVEAKSRVRPGILGQPGDPNETPTAGIVAIVESARQKADAIQDPYVVFVDVNLPPPEPTPIEEVGWLQEIVHEVEGRPDPNAPDPINLLMYTNHPHHYGAPGSLDPSDSWVLVYSQNARTPIAHPEAIQAIQVAADQQGRIPNWFEQPPTGLQ